MRHVKVLLQLHSIKLALISVCAISYLALTSTKTFDNAPAGTAVAVSADPSVNQESKSEGLAITENPRSRTDLGALTTPTDQPHDVSKIEGNLSNTVHHGIEGHPFII